jgi:hypothetical protein
MGIFAAVVVAMAVNAGPVEAKTAPVFNPSVCAKKRVDACGCHHVYGVRHCHTKRQTDHCEGMAQLLDSSSAPSWVDVYLDGLEDSSSPPTARQVASR